MLWMAVLAVVCLTAAQAAVPPAGSQIRNVASASYTTYAYTTPAGVAVPARVESIDSNAVLASITAVEALTLTQSQNVTRAPGTVVSMSHLLTNTGNVSSSYTLNWVNGGPGCAADSADLSSLRLVRDLNNNGVIDAGDPVIALNIAGAFSLSAGEVTSLLVQGTVPGGSAATACLSLSVTTALQAVTATNNDIVTIGNNAVMTLTKSASYPGRIIPGTSDISFTINGASIGARDAGPTAVATTGVQANGILVDGVPRTLVVVRDLIPAGTRFNAGTLTTTAAGAIKLYRKAGDATYRYSTTDPGAQAIEVAVGVPSAIVRNGNIVMSFSVHVLDTQTGNIVNNSQAYFNDGSTSVETESNTVVIGSVSVPTAIGLAKSAAAPVINRNSQGIVDGTASVTYTVLAKNYGDTPLYDVQISDLLEGSSFGTYTAATVPAANQYTVVAGSLAIGGPVGSPIAAINPAFTGKATGQTLLASGATLPVGATFTVKFTLRINQGGRSAILLNQAHVAAAKVSGGAATVLDDSTNGTDPDPDGDKNPGNNGVPTPVNLTGITVPVIAVVPEQPLVSRIGIAKSAVVSMAPPNAQGEVDGTAFVRFSLRVKNYGVSLLADVNVSDVLEGTGATDFGVYTTNAVPGANQYTVLPGSLQVVNQTGLTTPIVVDPSFTGQSGHQNMLGSGMSLPYAGEFTLQFDIRVHLLSRTGLLQNIARAGAALQFGNPVTVTDQSTNGIDPDPDNDGDPGNNSVSTPVDTAMPILKVVKTASLPRQVAIGVFDLDYTFKVNNVGNAPAPNVRLIDNLNCTFEMDLDKGAIASWELLGAPISQGRVLQPSTGYSGRASCDRAALANPSAIASVPTDTALSLVDAGSALAPNQSDVLRITVRVTVKPSFVGKRIEMSNVVWATSTSNSSNGAPVRMVAATSASAAALIVESTGVVYNSVSRQLIPGAVVSLTRTGSAGCAASAISASQLFGGATEGKYTYNADGSVSMTTGVDGAYQFYPIAGELCTYSIKVTPPAGSGYVFTSRMLPAQTGTYNGCGAVSAIPGAPQEGEDTRYYLSVSSGGGVTGSANASFCGVSRNHIPLDPGNLEGLILKKEGSKTQVEFGDFLDYALTASNKTGFPLSGIRFNDALPPGVAYIPGSARLNGKAVADPAGGVGPSLLWSFPSLTVDKDTSVTLRYRVRIGVGAPTEGDSINRARASSGPSQQIQSNLASWKVRISGGVFADDAYAFGKVMLNCKRDGVQNAKDDEGNVSHTDVGIPGVRLYLETGTFVVTDSEGKWSLYGLKPITHVLRLDSTTLPAGAKLEVVDNRNAGNPESRFLDLKKGEFAKANFIVSNCDDAAMLQQVEARRAAAGKTPDPAETLVRNRLDAEGKAVIVSGDLRGLPAAGQVSGASITGLGNLTATTAPLIQLPSAPATAGSTFVGATAGTLSGTLGASQPAASAQAGAGLAPFAQPVPSAQPMLPLAAPDVVDLEKLMPDLDNTVGFIGLKTGDTVASQQVNVRVKGPEGTALRLTVNGQAIDDRRVGKKASLPSKRLGAWEYIGVALKPGANSLKLEASDDFGNVRASQEITLTAPDKLSQIHIELPEGARADLRTPVVIKVRLTDASGVPVTARTQLTLELDRGRWLDEDLNPLEPGHQVFLENGQAEFRLLPPGEPGSVRVRVSTGNLSNDARLTLLPEIRPLIAVGMLEGTLDFTKRGGLAVSAVPAGAAFERELTGLASDGNDSRRAAARSAFFLKGSVRGDYLLTAAFDSDKTTKDRLFRDIRPDEFYPIYGDDSAKGFDAQSTQKLYLRIDKNRSYLLYGDFTTASSTEVRQLSQSNRSLTGVKNVYETDQVRATTYASRTSQTREVEEFQAVGTSGPYFLSASKGELVDNSERVEILVRDRNQPSVVLQTTGVTRNVDYTLEPLTRRILFTRAIASIDANLNPQSIRVSYEVDGGGNKFTVAGTDVQVKVGENLQLGVVASMDQNPENQRKLQAVTAIARLGANTSAAGEVVQTQSDLKGQGSAARVELRYQDEKLAAVALASKTNSAFDNPGASVASGRTEAAVRAEYKVDATTALRGEATFSKDESATANAGNSAKTVSASVQKKINDTLVAEVGVRHGQSTAGTNAGFDYGQISTINGTAGGTNGAGLVTASGNAQQEAVTTVRARLTSQVPNVAQAQVFVEAEQDVSHSDRRVLAAGANYALTDKTRAYGRYEFVSTLAGTDALATGSRNIGVLGVESNYMEGGRAYNEYRLADAIDGRSAQAALGLRNTFKLNDQWRATGGIENTRTLGANNSGNTGTGLAGVANNDSTAVISGLEYIGERLKASGVAEARVGHDAHTQLFSLGAAYKLDADWSLLGRTIVSNSEGQNTNEGNDRLLTRHQIGLALRPVNQDVWSALARFEHKSERVRGAGTAAGAADLGSFSSASLPGTYSADIISAHLNYNPARGQNITARYAGKISHADDGFVDSTYWANLLHARYTLDLSKDWDLGLQAGYLWGKGGARQRTMGLEVGYQAMKDLWVSVGYNVLGLKDRDLTGADYTSKGVYLRLRFKFDETGLGFAPVGTAPRAAVTLAAPVVVPASAPAASAEPLPVAGSASEAQGNPAAKPAP